MNADAQPNRRWYQFSLWSMFVWVTIIGLLLTVVLRWIAPAQQQRAVVQMVERLGGGVNYEDSPVHESRLKTWLRDWLPQDYFDAVELVDLGGTFVADADLQTLGGLTHLQRLWLYDTQLSGAGLAHLSGLAQLQSLMVNTQVTDDGLAHLSGLKHLQSLLIHDNDQLTDAGLAHLAGLTQLEEIHLDSAQVTDQGLAYLSGLSQLRWLSLNNTQVTDAGLARLCELTQLQGLWLNGTQVTDDGLERLTGLAQLQELSLEDTQVTDKGLAELRKALPNCKISH